MEKKPKTNPQQKNLLGHDTGLTIEGCYFGNIIQSEEYFEEEQTIPEA